jgi:murein DD-endopeptidase MepM/ murein hydrolase activator NlpD
MYFLGRIICILISISACTTKKIELTAAPTATKITNHWKQPASFIYVKEGDTWLTIEKKVNISFSILKRYNNSKKLKIGQKINLPEKNFHIVQNGETALEIAIKNGLTLSEIVILNDLQPNYDLFVGQNLKIIKVKMGVKIPVKNKKIHFIWPSPPKIIEKFGKQPDGKYNNDIILNANGDIKAAADGIVVYTGNEVGNYGNLIIIQHQGNWISSYGNLDNIFVKKDGKIKAGQKIGNINNSSLYFGLRDGTISLDPIKFLPKKNQL